MKKYNYNFNDYRDFCKRFNLKMYRYEILKYFKLVCDYE